MRKINAIANKKVVIVAVVPERLFKEMVNRLCGTLIRGAVRIPLLTKA
jgi:hypothetical protein